MWSKKVKYKLKLDEKTISLQFTQVDESIRRESDDCAFRLFKASNGIRISSAQLPELFGSTIYIFGTKKDNDYSIVKCTYSSVDRAQDVYRKYKAALEEAFPQNSWTWTYNKKEITC